MVGTIIGSGIFVVPNLVARSLPSEPWILAAWVFTGVLSFFGALAYAELGAMIPATGGQYVFLREAYGPLFGFLCGWTYFFIVISAAIAWLSITFATYVAYFVPLTPLVSKAIAVGLIAAVTLVNYRGVVVGAAVQKTFTLMKVLGLAVLVGAAFLGARHHAAPAAAASASAAVTLSGFGVAMIACLLSYDGWVALSFVAGEVKDPKRNLPLALALGLALAIAIYVLANVAYLRVLTPCGDRRHSARRRPGGGAQHGPGGRRVRLRHHPAFDRRRHQRMGDDGAPHLFRPGARRPVLPPVRHHSSALPDAAPVDSDVRRLVGAAGHHRDL